MKKWIIIGAVVAVPVVVVVLCLMLIGPRMNRQPHVRSYEMPLPNPPQGTVPLNPAIAVPTAEEAPMMVNPLAATDENIKRGGVYYQYYCAACHGSRGDGAGPVGESYVPSPADLRQARLRSYSDGQLLRAMLIGTGHEVESGRSVLNRIIPQDHRWYLIVYLRQLNSGDKR